MKCWKSYDFKVVKRLWDTMEKHRRGILKTVEHGKNNFVTWCGQVEDCDSLRNEGKIEEHGGSSVDF